MFLHIFIFKEFSHEITTASKLSTPINYKYNK